MGIIEEMGSRITSLQLSSDGRLEQVGVPPAKYEELRSALLGGEYPEHFVLGVGVILFRNVAVYPLGGDALRLGMTAAYMQMRWGVSADAKAADALTASLAGLPDERVMQLIPPTVDQWAEEQPELRDQVPPEDLRDRMREMGFEDAAP